MKFHQLSVGQRFHFDGSSYIKTGPMIASAADTGGQKFMARSARVEIIEQTPHPSCTAPRAFDAEDVHNALQSYHDRCLQCLERARPHLDAKSLAALTGELEAAKRDCLNALLES